MQHGLIRILASIHPWHSLLSVACLVLGLSSNNSGFSEEAIPSAGQGSLNQIVAEVQAALEIPNHIEVLIVEKNDLLVSAARYPRHSQDFRIICERDFINSLTAREIRAAMAHELGHIWIFTHHPYLQTEELADEIAGRIISKADLNQLHNKSQFYLRERTSASR